MLLLKKSCINISIIALILSLLLLIPSIGLAHTGGETIIETGNKKAAILIPAYNEINKTFSPVRKSLESAGYEVVTLLGEDVNLNVLRQLSQYSVIFLLAHGSSGKGNKREWSCFRTMITADFDFWKSHYIDFIMKRVVKFYIEGKKYIGVMDNYLSEYNKDFPNTLMYTFSCNLLGNDSMINSLGPRGVQAILGFSSDAVTQDVPKDKEEKDYPEAYSTLLHDQVTVAFFEKTAEQSLSVEDAYWQIQSQTMVPALDSNEPIPSFCPEWELKTKYDQDAESFYIRSRNNEETNNKNGHYDEPAEKERDLREAAELYDWSIQHVISNEILTDISVADANNVWVVSDRGGIYYFNGSSWTKQFNIEWYYGYCHQNLIFALDNTHVWATTDFGKIYFFNGSNWQEQRVPYNWDRPIKCLFGLSNKQIFAGGNGCKGSYQWYGELYCYDGTAWSIQAITAEGNIQPSRVNGITGTDKDHLWITSPEGIFFFDGTVWRLQFKQSNMGAICASDKDHVWAVGSNGIFSFNGSSWSKQTEIRPGYPIRDICALDNRHVWAAGDDGIYFSDGLSWTKLYEGSYKNFQAISAIDKQHIWAISNNFPNGYIYLGYIRDVN